jgi:hypothetical protein
MMFGVCSLHYTRPRMQLEIRSRPFYEVADAIQVDGASMLAGARSR